MAASMTQLSFSPEEMIDHQIDAILAGEAGPWKLQPDELVVLRMLRSHKGSLEPLPLERITVQMGMSPRMIKRTMKSLIEDFGLPIGGSREKPFGYFLIVAPDDLRRALRPLAHEMRSMRRRMDSLEAACRAMPFFEQTRLALEEEAVHHGGTEDTE